MRVRLGPALAFLAFSLAFSVSCSSCAPATKRVREPDGRPPRSTREAFEELQPAGGKTDVALLSDNATAWVERWRLIDGAKERIDATYFIVDPDVFGFAFLGHLYERAAAGVKIRFLLDGRGSDKLLQPL